MAQGRTTQPVQRELDHLLQLNENWTSKTKRLGLFTKMPKALREQMIRIHHRLGQTQEQACQAILSYDGTKRRKHNIDPNEYFKHWQIEKKKGLENRAEAQA